MSTRSFSFHDLIERNAFLHGARPAFICGGNTTSHAKYADRAAHLAGGLSHAGLEAGDRVILVAPNGQPFVDVLGAAALLGAIVVPVNWRLSSLEVAHVINDVRAKVIVAAPEMLHLLPEHLLEGSCFTLGSPIGAWRAFDELYSDRKAPPKDVDDASAFLIVHTAAIAGRSRGAVLSHRGLLSAASHAAQAMRLNADDVFVGVLPLFHLLGLGLSHATQWAGGATLLVPRFEADSLAGQIHDAKGSLIGSFSPMLEALCEATEKSQTKISSLRIGIGLEPRAVIERFETMFAPAKFWVGYGQTETSGMLSLAPASDRPGSAGLTSASPNRIAIVDESGEQLALGRHGEIVVRGPMVFAGYWDSDREQMDKAGNGWHHTGDLGHVDALGYLWYAGRTSWKDLIKSGGENIYPAEIEKVLLKHVSVKEAVVFGVPDERWGEAVMAVCVAESEVTEKKGALSEFVAKELASYKKPKYIVFAAELPHTASGEIDRDAVRAMYGPPQQAEQ